MKTAIELAAKGIKIFHAGIWKPRTKPGCFEGIGVEGLAWLKKAKKAYPHRTSLPHPGVAHLLRPKPHRRETKRKVTQK